MSAIEMMDPKMDAGMAKGSVKRRTPLTLTDAIEEKSLPWDNVTVPEFVTIFDHTLSCLVTWLEGHSLAQTVLTNLVSTRTGYNTQIKACFFSSMLSNVIVPDFMTTGCVNTINAK